MDETRQVLGEELSEMALRLQEAPNVEETEKRIPEQAVRLLGGSLAGLCILRGRLGVELAATTDPLVADLVVTTATPTDPDQGPELAVLGAEPIRIVTDTRYEPRWPVWAERAFNRGVRSALCVRVSTLSATLGTLTVYDDAPACFDQRSGRDAQALGAHAAIALVSAQQRENLWQAVDARKLIGQAQGMLMERFRLDTDQAFAVLLRYSQDKNLKLRAVAEHLVGTRELPT